LIKAELRKGFRFGKKEPLQSESDGAVFFMGWRKWLRSMYKG